MSDIELIVIGASAGGLDGVLTIVRQLPARLPACVIVVVHNNGRSHLPAILARVSELPVAVPENGDEITPGRILVAPQDYHLLVNGRHLVLHSGPRENGFRPAIDPLFRTAARAYGSRVMGVVLSGALDDGTYGMQVIKGAGGLTVVQHPDEAPIPSMPLSALANVEIDHVMRAAEIADLIVERAAPRAAKETPAMAEASTPEPQDPADQTQVHSMMEIFGPPSGITCPNCGGALWEVRDGQLVRYRCHVGHQFSPEGLEAGQNDAVEGALWSAVRALEEQANLRQRMAERAEVAGLNSVCARFSRAATESHRQAGSIRNLLFARPASPAPEPVPPRDATPRAKPRRARAKAGSRRAS